MKILFFAPHAALWSHSYPEAVVAEALESQGHEIVYVACNRVYQKFCVPMNAFGLSQTSSESERRAICDHCYDMRALLKKRFKFREILLGDHISDADRKATHEITNLPPEELKQFAIDGVSIGKLAAYELMLKSKRTRMDFNAEEWSAYVVAFSHNLQTYYAANRLMELEKPDRVLVYNSLYSVNNVFVKVAELHRATPYFLHAYESIYDRLNRIIVAKSDALIYSRAVSAQWENEKLQPQSAVAISAVRNHFTTLFSGKHFLAYSAAAGKSPDIRKFFKISPEKKVIVATLSSYDEIIALEMIGMLKISKEIAFRDQIEWMQAVVQYIAGKPDLFLIIRVHPREFPNHRDAVRSEHSLRLEKVFQKLPLNAVINWPADSLSIYDLAKEADLFLNAWSSVGEEMTLLGFPVLLYSDEMLFYSPAINYLEKSSGAYFTALEDALREGWSGKNIVKGFRWYAYKFFRPTFTVSHTFSYRENPILFTPPKRDRIMSSVIQKFMVRFPFLKSILPLRFRYLNEMRELCRETNPAEATDLATMLCHKLPIRSPIPRSPEECPDCIQELLLIKEQMKNIMEQLFPKEIAGETEKPLYKRLSGWLNSNE